MLVTLNELGEMHFRVLGTNRFHVKAKNERSTPAGSRCSRGTSKQILKFYVVVLQTSTK